MIKAIYDKYEGNVNLEGLSVEEITEKTVISLLTHLGFRTDSDLEAVTVKATINMVGEIVESIEKYEIKNLSLDVTSDWNMNKDSELYMESISVEIARTVRLTFEPINGEVIGAGFANRSMVEKIKKQLKNKFKK